MKRFLLDVDETLLDFGTPVADAVSQIKGCAWTPALAPPGWNILTGLTRDEFLDLREIICKPAWSEALQPRPGACRFVRDLKGLCDVYLVTACFASWMSVRVAHLYHHFAVERNHQVFMTDKHLLRGSWMLDDNPDHGEQWLKEEPQGIAWLWNTFGNLRVSSSLPRINNYNQVLSLVEEQIA